MAPVGYEQFRQMAWSASQRLTRDNPHGVLSIRALRQALRQIPTTTFDEHLVRLERNGLIYLIPPEDPDSIDEDERRAALDHPAGDLRAFLLWMGPKTRPASYFWD
jgi:hypothetical protein